MATTYDLTLDQGSYWSKSLLWQDADANPIDLSGYSARMEVRPEIASGTLYATLVDGDGITLGGAAGTILLEVAADVSSAIPYGKHRYDLELDPGDGKIKRLIQGSFTVSGEVTR